MDKAILKTLIYADIFDYPLKAWEIHKWLISKKGSLRQVEKRLKDKSLESRVKSQGGYYFLKGRKDLVEKRKKREKISERYYSSAKFVLFFFRLIPWIRLIGISGSLSLKNSQRKDDIDFFTVTSKKRIWLSRLLLLSISSIMGKRRKKSEKATEVTGKYCINILLEEDHLAQKDKNIYLAHEVLQMDVLYQKESVYQKYLEENSWAFKYLPNWISGQKNGSSRLRSNEAKPLFFEDKNNYSSTKHSAWRSTFILDILENLAKNFQLKHMGTPRGQEKISDGALYFLPVNKQSEILKEYQKRLKKFRVT